MTFLDLIPKSAYAALIAVLMVTTVKLHWDKSGLVVDVAVGKTQIAQLETAIATANQKSAEISNTLTRKVLDAQAQAKQREANLLAEKHDLDTALDSLRLSTGQARATYRLSGPTATASYQQFSASLDALDQCAKEYSDVAAVADSYGSDLKTLMVAWPTKKE